MPTPEIRLFSHSLSPAIDQASSPMSVPIITRPMISTMCHLSFRRTLSSVALAGPRPTQHIDRESASGLSTHSVLPRYGRTDGAIPSRSNTPDPYRRRRARPGRRGLLRFPNRPLTYITHSRVHHASPFFLRLYAAMRYTHLAASCRISARALVSLLRALSASPPKKTVPNMRLAAIK